MRHRDAVLGPVPSGLLLPPFPQIPRLPRAPRPRHRRRHPHLGLPEVRPPPGGRGGGGGVVVVGGGGGGGGGGEGGEEGEQGGRVRALPLAAPLRRRQAARGRAAAPGLRLRRRRGAAPRVALGRQVARAAPRRRVGLRRLLPRAVARLVAAAGRPTGPTGSTARRRTSARAARGHQARPAPHAVPVPDDVHAWAHSARARRRRRPAPRRGAPRQRGARVGRARPARPRSPARWVAWQCVGSGCEECWQVYTAQCHCPVLRD